MVLKEMADFLKSKSGKVNYAIPKLWIPFWYEGEVKEIEGKYFVDPYDFYSTIVEKLLKMAGDKDYSGSISQIKGDKDSSWIKRSKMYAMFIRSSASYNHKGFGRFEPEDVLGYRESGTFLKAIAILMYLKRLDINAVYLLPVSKTSNVFKKGEVGSPYAVKNPMELEPSYHDPLLEGFTVEEEFKAFVEAAHILDMRVLLDFIPRTAARDSDLIREHPDWFYWIKVEDLPSYEPPKIPGMGFKIPEESDLEYIYSLEGVQKHLKKFSPNPRELDPQKWENIVRSNPKNLLEEIVKEFGLITPPGFSDWINDPQPTWDDVTFLRLYMDPPKAAKRFLDYDQPPYILFDVIKASLFPGDEENVELWSYISSTVPSYQKRFGIDGIRLDMGHALPKKLERMIMDKAREIDPAFAFIAEELDVSKGEEAKKSGYDAIIGNSWWMMPRVPEKAYEFYQDVAPKLPIPFLASAETPDTPRIRAREFGEDLKKLIPFLLAFAPNGIFFVNSGQELGEIQPMNLGLDNNDEGKAVLPPSDEFFAKLAFFDHYALHWDKFDEESLDFLRKLSVVKGIYSDILEKGEYRPVWFDWQDGKTANASFWLDGKAVIAIGNLDRNPRSVRIDMNNTKGGGISVGRMRIWNGERWESVRDESGWISVTLDGLSFNLIEVFYEEV